MKMKVDARGLSCPEPVLLARQAMQEAGKGTITILVSSAAARDNVSRAAKTMGWEVSVDEQGDEFNLTLSLK